MLPLSLRITVIVIIVLLILLFIAIRKKNRNLIQLLFVLVVLCIGFGIWKGLKEYNRTNEDLSTVKADIKIPAVDLIHDYEKNDSVANLKYVDKVIEADGNIKDIEKDEKGYYTIILGAKESTSSVRCSMDTLHTADAARLSPGSSVVVRGACNGFKKNGDLLGVDLGSDVELNRCVIVPGK
jgi:hypothetical protein